MTLDPNINKRNNVKSKPITNINNKPKTKLTKENYEKLKKLTGKGFVSIYKK